MKPKTMTIRPARWLTCLLFAGLCLPLVACSGRGTTNHRAAVVDRAFDQLCASADTALVEQGDAMLAYKLYSQALERSYTTMDPAAFSRASFGQAASLARLRRYEQALSSLVETGFTMPPERRQARALLSARIRLEQGRAGDAETDLKRAEALSSASTSVSTQMLIELTHGQIAVMTGDLARAKQSIEAARGIESQGLAVQLHRLRGMIASGEGRHKAAGAAYDDEARAARAVSNWPSAAEATARAASAYAASGESQKAAERYFQAGRSAMLQKEAVLPAEAWLESARQQAAAAGDQDLLERIEALNPNGLCSSTRNPFRIEQPAIISG